MKGQVVFLLALSLGLVHGPRLLSDDCCEYVSYDDPANFKHNPYINRLTWSNVHWAITDGVVLVSRPPLSLPRRAESRSNGLESDLLHAWMLTRRWIGARPGRLGTGKPDLSHGLPDSTRRECAGMPGCERSPARVKRLRRLRVDCTAVRQRRAMDGMLRMQCAGCCPAPTVR